MGDSPKSLRWTLKSRQRSKAGTAPVSESSPADSPNDEALMAALAEDIIDSESQPVWKGCCIHAVNGVELIADPWGIAYWPVEDTLLVADLHLEKGSSFARRGQLLPPYDTMETLKRFSAAVEKWQPKRVMALGDSFHDREAHKRLSTEAMDAIATMMVGRDWVWISGNHDPNPLAGLGGELAKEIETGRLVLRHDPLVNGKPGEVAGHLHPKARLIKRGRHVRRSCFAASRSRMILPSFGAYTGGLNVFDAAFDGLFDGRNFHVLMRGEDQLYKIAATDLS
ncbi:MAG: ligase-associated DNA damage response endonuclease PdeM [Rhizobiaceae bacterium]